MIYSNDFFFCFVSFSFQNNSPHIMDQESKKNKHHKIVIKKKTKTKK